MVKIVAAAIEGKNFFQFNPVFYLKIPIYLLIWFYPLEIVKFDLGIIEVENYLLCKLGY